ncbi:GntR family transcriptional regulator [Peribacillus huizhouensis]|uniref:GntR family transcriptional regulator n=1 Tax=Peribacillus huizhouensis TaxID=1501239 RepID=A0ABR6CJT1_9BACI|nr:GntR family transcriptional regulator [Peribacillus huizhouensis]MBA9025149.1 GntR family transcriptional regulator [Peribacillus huizhouensis]
MIDKSSPIPIYYQIEESIKRQIDAGDLLPHNVLPSEREFAEQLEISRMTVRQAINNLVNTGYLYRQKGRGTFVAEKKLEQQLLGLTGFTEEMKARGMTPSSKLLSLDTIPSSEKIASQLHVTTNAPIYEIIRIRLADNVPMALETAYMSADLIKGLTAEIINYSIYQYVENHLGLKIGYATQSLESTIATDVEIASLSIAKHSPILLIERTTYLEDGRPLEFVKSSYRADRYKFTCTINRR